MSGGSYDYAFTRINDFIGGMVRTTPLRKAFAKHLEKVSQAMHDIEWVDSGDCGPGDEDAAIRAVLGKGADAEVSGRRQGDAGGSARSYPAGGRGA